MTSVAEVEIAARRAREIATRLNFSAYEIARVLLVVSELGTNLCRYARAGALIFEPASRDDRWCLRIESHDGGPGIEDLELALRDGSSTGGGLGGGLPAVRRLANDFEIRSSFDGTQILTRIWRR